jgi:uncharacterized OB-fold protein
VGHFDPFEFMLGRCRNCGAYFMDEFCVASNTSGYERVSDDDVKIMLYTTSITKDIKHENSLVFFGSFSQGISFGTTSF